MIGLGSGNNGEFTFLDTITIISFIIGLINLDENLTQSDKQDLQKELSGQAKKLLNEIHGHLEIQDEKLDSIINMLEVKNEGR